MIYQLSLVTLTSLCIYCTTFVAPGHVEACLITKCCQVAGDHELLAGNHKQLRADVHKQLLADGHKQLLAGDHKLA